MGLTMTSAWWQDGREQAVLAYIRQHWNSLSLHGNPSALVAAMDDFSYQRDLLVSLGSQEAATFRDLFAVQKPEVVIELGRYLG